MPAHADLPLGRRPELARIAAFLELEPPAALVLEGDAGIGKTRVWQEGIRLAREAGCRILTARAAGSEVQLSFAALADLLDGVALPELPPPQRRALEAALLLDDPQDAPPEARATAAALLGVLRRLSASAPLLLALDDVQWLDTASAGALAFALRRLETEPLRVLATARGAPGDPLPPLLDRTFTDDRLLRIALGPLAPGTLHELLRERLALNLPRPALLRLAELCGGNPFFALEVGRELQRRGARITPGEPLPIPGGLRRLVGERIARLPARTRALVLRAAAVPQPSVALLRAACANAAEVDEDVDIAVRGGVLEHDGDRLRFTHPLLAATTYSQASAEDRRAAHRALAGAAPDAQERARHLALAAAGPSEDVAAALEAAAAHARRRGAPEDSADLCEQSVRLTPPALEPERRRRTLVAADHRFVAGDTARARTLLEDAVGSAPPGPPRARALLLLARIEHEAEGAGAAVALCERALGEPRLDAALEAEAHFTLAVAADVDNRRRDEHARRALALLERARDPDPALQSAALVAYALAEFYVGRGLRRDELDRAVALEPPSRRPRAAWTAGTVLGQLLKYTDDYDAARPRLEAAHRRALDEGDESSLPDIAGHLCELELWTGDWAAADRYARESLAVAERARQALWRGIGLYCRALVDAHLGRVEDARAHAEQGLALGCERRDPWLEGICLWALGFLELSCGDHAAVERHLSRADAIAEAIGLVEPGQWRFHPDRIEALVALGEHERAAQLLGRYDARAAAVARPHALAAAERCRALLAAARGDLDGARAALAAALERHGPILLPFERARTLLALGTVERRASRKRAARETLEPALAAFERLGAPLWAARARSELARIGGRRAPAGGALSETEARIAALAAAGRTNTEIAAELIVSPKTVKWNLSKVYRKLGVRSRTELAAALAAGARAPARE